MTTSLNRGALAEQARRMLEKGQTISEFIQFGMQHQSTEQSCRTTWARVQRELRAQANHPPVPKKNNLLRESKSQTDSVTRLVPIELILDDAEIESLVEDGIRYRELKERTRKKIAKRPPVV